RQSISVASVCIQPRPSRIVSIETDSVQSLLRATRPLPRRVSLTMMDQSMIDAASGGALMDKTPATTRHLISNMASNTQ
ncbi:hypothetical protein CR513_07135, partial [Mucuna pruriens]